MSLPASENQKSKYYLITWGLPDLNYVITENKAQHLVSVPKELVGTITHSSDLSSNITFLGKPSLIPKAKSGSPRTPIPAPAERAMQPMLLPGMLFRPDLVALGFPRAAGHWLGVSVPLGRVVQEGTISLHLLSFASPRGSVRTVEGWRLPRTPDA